MTACAPVWPISAVAATIRAALRLADPIEAGQIDAGGVMKYLCLVYEEERRFADMPAAEWAALREAVLEHVEALRADGRLIDARPLQSATTARTIRVRSGRRFVTDGPFAETKEQIGGYFIIEADSLDDALDLAATWPSAHLGTIEVRPLEDGLRTDTRYARDET